MKLGVFLRNKKKKACKNKGNIEAAKNEYNKTVNAFNYAKNVYDESVKTYNQCLAEIENIKQNLGSALSNIEQTQKKLEETIKNTQNLLEKANNDIKEANDAINGVQNSETARKLKEIKDKLYQKQLQEEEASGVLLARIASNRKNLKQLDAMLDYEQKGTFFDNFRLITTIEDWLLKKKFYEV